MDTLLLSMRKRRVASSVHTAGAFIAVTSQHEFVLGEQVVRKVVAYSHVKSDCWFPGWTEVICSACLLARDN
jgi:hypothetical protein